jgi:hypothetical protein
VIKDILFGMQCITPLLQEILVGGWEICYLGYAEFFHLGKDVEGGKQLIYCFNPKDPEPISY